MIKGFIKVSFRNLIRFKTHSIINIAGLAVGITCFITLSLFIEDELSYDKFYKNAGSIYRVYVKSSINGQESRNCKTGAPLGATMMRDFPEVINYTRIGYFGSHVLKYKDKVFRAYDMYTADSTFFDVFSLRFISGNPKTALVQPNSIVLTKTVAKRFFGNENPVGKILGVDSSVTYLVTGVIEDFPRHSSFSCGLLLSMSTYPVTENNHWLDMWYTTYVVLKKGTDPDVLQKKLEKIVYNDVGPQAELVIGVPMREFLNKGNRWGLYLQPLTSIYLYSQRDYGIDPNTEWSQQKTSDIEYVYIFTAVAIFILFLAVINFMNLTTARSETRAKEVGIRKTLGSNKAKLVGQFLTESIMVCFAAVIVALALLEIILPLFNQFINRNLELNLFDNFFTIPILILFVIVVGILAGSYPAFYLSSFRPVHLLRAKFDTRYRKSTLRSGLVVIQFAVSIALLIGTIIIKNQLDYIQNKKLGFNKENLYAIKNAGILGERLEPFKQELLKNPNITTLTNSSVMFTTGIPGNGYLYNKKMGTDPISSQFIDVDYNFLKTFQIPMVQGRFFSKEFSTDTSAVVINQAMMKECGTIDPIGKEITQLGIGNEAKTYKIIGVAKDFNYQSLHQQIQPLIFFLHSVRQPANVLTMRVSSNGLKNTVGFINDTWKKFANGEGIYSAFVDQDIAKLYDSEEKVSVVATIFSGLAIFIACLGLFGLASFVTEQRTKEIGIRKALGASVSELVMMLSKEFTKWIILANLIAWPVAYFVMKKWLQNFAYRININILVFIIAGAAALTIALLTISYHAIKASLANPVDSLRYE
jgi:putative ABC transport system permease protein